MKNQIKNFSFPYKTGTLIFSVKMIFSPIIVLNIIGLEFVKGKYQ